MKKILSIALTVCMIVSIFTAIPVSARTYLTEYDITIDAPKAGEPLPTNASMPESASTYVTNVEWSGTLDENGNAKAGEKYTVKITVRVKDSASDTFMMKSQGKPTVNGNSAKLTEVSKDFKEGIIQYAFGSGKGTASSAVQSSDKPKLSEEQTLDLRKIYSVQEANARWAEGYPQHPSELIINTQDKSLSRIYVDADYEALCLKRVLLDYEVEFYNEDDAYAMVYLSNLKEVWLSPKVDLHAFIGNLSRNSRFQKLFFESGGATTYNFTLYVSDTTLPNGYDSSWYLDNTHKMFRTKIYSGDVYEAFKQGDSAARDWCTNHEFTRQIQWADRIYKHKTCQNPVMYYYSCNNCGLPEKNPNHTFSKNEYYEYDYSKYPHSYTIMDLSAKNYIGKNPAGDDVYLYSCNWCGMNKYEYDTIHYSREDFKADFGPNAELTYEYYMDYQKKSWEKTIATCLEKATVESDWIEAFAVKGNPAVTANYSSWAENEIRWANANDLLDLSLLGSDYTWGINRQQFCSVAVRLAEKLTGKEIAAAPATTFNDTDNIYVLKAYSAGITSGTGEGTFSPYTTLTREQMATFIHRALMYVKNNSKIRYTPYESKLGSFSDSWSISSWANEPMAFMNALGLINGKSDTAIEPQGTCTIQEAILVAQRSVKADEIGYYQAILPGEENLTGWTSGQAKKIFLPTSNYQWMYAQHSYACGDRIWVTGPKVGKMLPLTDEYNGQTIWANYVDFKPIRELSNDDIYAYEYYYKNNRKKFEPFVAPAYKGTK
ncbi:MAG: S-layer homology domain-containing protein [Clostridia bacterium]|nr:S-layer homology domain-containing protein [Clostridia bacterium]